jgi:hypothetical protein
MVPKKILSFNAFASRHLRVIATIIILCAVPAATKSPPLLSKSAEDEHEAKSVFYTTSDTFSGSPGGAEIWAIEVSQGKVATKHIGSSYGGDCISLALSPSTGKLYSMCGSLFGTQYLATIDQKTGLASQVGISVSGLAVMAMTFGPDGTLYAVGDCNPDPTFECNTVASPTDPNFNSLYKVQTKTGASTPVGAFTRMGSTGAPQFFMDLAFDRNGNMYGVTTTDNPSVTPAVLYRINPATGTAAKAANLVGSNMVMGLAFGRDGNLYGTDFMNSPGLYVVDINTGFETAIAALPFCCSSALKLVSAKED